MHAQLTFGSFRTFGVLNVARTDALDAEVVKPRGSCVRVSLADAEVEVEVVDLEANVRRPTLREAIVGG